MVCYKYTQLQCQRFNNAIFAGYYLIISFVAVKFYAMNQQVNIGFSNNIKITIKREDVLHPHISGNKWRKLKYNLLEAQKEEIAALLTFGGAFSNHIAATAAAGREYGLKTIGVIRGEELKDKISDNPTLLFARQCGMEFKFISREQYRDKMNPKFLEALDKEFGHCYILPEGGTNALAVKGCEEIITQADAKFSHIACAVGTGGTISGVINSAFSHQKVLGFPALKADLSDDILKFAQQGNWLLINDYHFGGYARVNKGLIAFINDFYDKTAILLDPVYTGKMVFGVMDLISKNYFPENSDILMIHTGGLQGIEGMNRELIKKKLPIIKT